MPNERRAWGAALASAVVLAAVCIWGYTIDPDPPTRWIVIAVGLPLVWSYVEAAQVRGPDRDVGTAIIALHRWTFAWAGLLLASQIGIRLSVAADLLSPDQWLVGRRVTGIALGAGLMLFGNFLPKLLSPWRLEDEPFDWQHVHRFCGWVFLLGGLGVTLCWILAPGRAPQNANLVLAATTVLAVGRKAASLVSRNAARIGAR